MKVINRIKASDDFALTIKKGRTYKNQSYTIHAIKTDRTYSRVGLSVSTKIGNAVVRSRVKRQLRAMCDNLINYDKSSFDLVIIVRNKFLDNSFQDNQSLLRDLLNVQVGVN